MTHVRTQLREAVRLALIAALPGVSWQADWWTKVTARQLPRGAVGTPRSGDQRIDIGAVDRTTDLMIVLKRAGTETIEDDLDADSVVVEAAVLSVLAGLSDDYALSETQVSVDGAADTPIGELSMLFRTVLRTGEGDPETLII